MDPADGGPASGARAEPRPWPGHELLAWRRQCLARGGRAVDFDWLLDLAGGLPWSQLQRLRLDPDRPVQLRFGQEDLEQLWERHLRTAAPLQYLVGVCPWRDELIRVGPGVLIPRQETELMVDLVRRLQNHPPALWADLGTGSGCLAVALAQQWPRARGMAVDVSPVALDQARSNLRGPDLISRVELLQGSWWDPLEPWWGELELVVANPPYIPSTVWSELEPGVRDHEPRLALDGGPDGLDAVRQVAAGAPRALAAGGCLVLEHHHDQSEQVGQLLRQAGLTSVQAHRDLENKLRFASARKAEA